MSEELSHRALCSVADVDGALGLNLSDPDSRTDQVTRLINAASSEIYSFTDREFVASLDYWDEDDDTETREFDMAWSGIGNNVVEVGDMMEAPKAVTIRNVFDVTVMNVPLTSIDLFPKVRQSWQPYTFLRLLTYRMAGSNYSVSVTSKWGFPAIPEDVRHACIETVRLWWDQQNLHSGTIEQEMIANQPNRNLPPHVIQSLNKYRRYRG